MNRLFQTPFHLKELAEMERGCKQAVQPLFAFFRIEKRPLAENPLPARVKTAPCRVNVFFGIQRMVQEWERERLGLRGKPCPLEDGEGERKPTYGNLEKFKIGAHSCR